MKINHHSPFITIMISTYPEAYPSPSHWWYPLGPILLVGDFELVLPAKRPMVSCDICAGSGGIRTCKLAMPKHGHAYLMNKGPHSSEVLKGFRPTRLHSSLVSFQDMIHMIEHTTIHGRLRFDKGSRNIRSTTSTTGKLDVPPNFNPPCNSAS